MNYQEFLTFVLTRKETDTDTDFFVSHPIAPHKEFILSTTEMLTLLIENPSSTFLITAIEK